MKNKMFWILIVIAFLIGLALGYFLFHKTPECSLQVLNNISYCMPK